MKCVITGSNGFIGTMLQAKLVGMGAEVRCLIRSGSGAGKPAKTSTNGITHYAIDYADPESLINSGALNDAEYVFHVAGVTKQLTLEGFRRGNVMPTQHLVEALTQLKTPLKRFVLISSQAAAGPAKSASAPVLEAHNPAPIEDYGLSKLEAENILREQQLPFSYTTIRPAAVYGPKDVDFLALFKQLKNGLGIYPANRNSFVSIIYVNDLVDGIINAAMHDNTKNQTYFLAKDIAVTWHQIYSFIADIWGSKLREINLPFGLISIAGHLGDIYSKITGKITVLNSKKIDLAKPAFWVCSSEKAQKDFGFDPQTTLPGGLRQTFSWYKEAGWL
ncbi:MAG: NAD-dependent epimerase/dehydratase family protein [Rhodothermales bacterium]